MILGIGIDIVHIDRMKKWLVRPFLVQRYFHPEEITDAEKTGSFHASFPCCKVLLQKKHSEKALGTGLMGNFHLKKFRLKNNHNGKPDIRLYGKAKAAFEKDGRKKPASFH